MHFNPTACVNIAADTADCCQLENSTPMQYKI